MDSLPTELHYAIAAFLPSQDRPVYRLVNKQCADIGASFYFENFLCKPTAATLERMSLILKSPLSNIKRHVKVLDYTGELEEAEARNADPNLQVTTIWELLKGFTQGGSPVSTLAALTLHPGIFAPENFYSSAIQHSANITRLDLYFQGTDANVTESHKNLRKYIASLEHLCDLSLDFADENFWVKRRGQGLPCLRDIFPLDRPGQWLRSISLACVCITASDLITLLNSCRDALSCFHFRGLTFQGQGVVEHGDEPQEWRKQAWRRIFEQFQRFGELKHAEFKELAKGGAKDRKWEIEVKGRKLEIDSNLEKYFVDGKEKVVMAADEGEVEHGHSDEDQDDDVDGDDEVFV